MSKLAKAVMARQTDRKVLMDLGPVFNNTVNIKEEFSTIAHARWGKMYRIEARFGAQVIVDELDEIKNPNALSFAVESCKCQIVHAVFGEFQEDFRLIESALWERDFDKSRTLLSDMERKMFTTE